MKKLSVLLMSICAATALVACGSGSSNSSGGGNVAPSGCPDGTSQCGSNTDAKQYEEKLPNSQGYLLTATNVVIGNGESVTLEFAVKDITSPVTISFASSNGSLNQLQTNQLHTATPSCTFESNQVTDCKITLQTDNATSYSIIPSVNSDAMKPVEITTAPSVAFQLPLGTYKDNSRFIWFDSITGQCQSFDAVTEQATVVNTESMVYLCFKNSANGSYCTEAFDSRYPAMQLPSGTADFYGSFVSVSYYNGGWSNGVLNLNVKPYAAECSSSTIRYEYQSSSTIVPFGIY